MDSHGLTTAEIRHHDADVERQLQEIRAHPVRLRALVWQTIVQGVIAFGAAVAAGIAVAPAFYAWLQGVR